MAAQSSNRSAPALLDLIAGHRVTATIHAAARLGIADLLADGPRSAAELAKSTDAHEPSVLRLMRALVTLGICVDAGGGKYQLTEMGHHLTARSDPSLKAMALLEGEFLRTQWNGFVDSIRTGKTFGELLGGGPGPFERIAETGQAEVFNQAMRSVTSVTLPGILAAYDFSGIAKLMDVGGGLGHLLAAIITKYPSMRGVVYDLPHCADGARKNLADSGVADRTEFIGGSFFESVPAVADAIVMKSIIHDWDDERCVKILNNCRRALKPNARLIVIDRVVPDQLEANADCRDITLMDLNMLRVAGGCERTEHEHRELLAKGGFRLTRCANAGRANVIESVAA
jgi:SAM-dependent methyltransferase